jgi:hypothetical protein
VSPHAAGEPPDFVAVGHLTVDELPADSAPAARVHAGLMAQCQGRGADDELRPRFPATLPLPETTPSRFPRRRPHASLLHYTPTGRTLTLRARAAALAPLHLPERFAEAGIAYLAPVADEVSADFAAAFPDAAVGVGAQGWCRRWDRDGRVSMRPWPDPAPVLARAQALFLSSDDVAGWERQALQLYQQVPIGALTWAAGCPFVNEALRRRPTPAAESSRPAPGRLLPSSSPTTGRRSHGRRRSPRWRAHRGSGSRRPVFARTRATVARFNWLTTPDGGRRAIRRRKRVRRPERRDQASGLSAVRPRRKAPARRRASDGSGAEPEPVDGDHRRLSAGRRRRRPG